MGKASKIDLAQLALDVISTKNGAHYDFSNLTLKDAASAAAKGAGVGAALGAARGAVKAGLVGSTIGPEGTLGGALAGGAAGAATGAVGGAAREVLLRASVKDGTYGGNTFDLDYPGAPSHVGEADVDPGNPFGTDAGRHAFASDVLKRAMQKDIEIRNAVAVATQQAAADMRAKGVSADTANRAAAASVQNGLIDQIAVKLKAQYDKNTGGQDAVHASDALLRPQSAMPAPPLPYSDSLMRPQTAMPEPASGPQGNGAPVTGDRPLPADAPGDDGDEFGPKSLPPGRRLYDSVNPFNLMKGLL